MLLGIRNTTEILNIDIQIVIINKYFYKNLYVTK